MRSLLTCILMIPVIYLPGQITIDFITFPPPGDSITRFTDLTPEGVTVTEPGGDQLWQWTLSDQLQFQVRFDTNDRPDLFPFADIKATSGLGSDYYQITSEQWNLLGENGLDPLGFGFDVASFYLPGQRVESAPLAYGDSLEQQFDVYTGIPLSFIPDSLLELLPVVPDSMRARVNTFQRDDVDAWGVLEINGEPLDVLRQRRELRLAIAIEAKISILPWADVTDLLINYFDFLPFEVNLNDTLLSYRYLAPNYGMPVAEVFIDSNTVASVEYQTEILSSSEDVRPELQRFTVFPNPSSGLVTVDWSEIEAGVGRILIIDMNGRLVSHARTDGNTNFELNLVDESPGIYAVTLWDSAGRLLGIQKVQIMN